MMEENKHIVWSNRDLDYEKDWKADLEAEHPEMTKDDRVRLMYETNNDYLNDERENLNIRLGKPIIVIADLGLWDGKHKGYKYIESGNIKDCLYDNGDYIEWYVDESGDLRCIASHHDGTNHYLYRVLKKNLTEDQKEELEEMIYNQRYSDDLVEAYTEKIGTYIADVYGFVLGKES